MSEIRLNVVGACERIVEEASRLAGQNYAYNLKRKTGALDAINALENGPAVEQATRARLITQQNGRKLAKLHIYYDQRTKPCQISQDCDQSVCDDGVTPVRKEVDITIDNCLKTPVRSYSNDDMAALCNDTENFMRDRGFNDLRAAKELWSERIMAEMISMKGINHQFNGADIAAGVDKDIQLLYSSNGQSIPQPGNFAKMMLDYRSNQLMGTPLIVGEGNFELFWELHGMSCCNSETPFGTANMSGKSRFYVDDAANEVLGMNHLLMFAPGAVKLLTFNENRNIQATGVNTNDRMNIVIPDPDGYPFDWNLDFYFDNCMKTWKSMYSVLWGLFNVFQDDSFADDGEDTSPDVSPDCADELDGMTGVFGYHVTEG